MPGRSPFDRAAAEARLVAHCKWLLDAGTYPSVAEIRKCRGVPRNGHAILAARQRAIDAGLLVMTVDPRRKRKPGPKGMGMARATPDPEGFIKPLIAALDPPRVTRERRRSPCWKEIRDVKKAVRTLGEWLARRTEATCPI